MKNTYIALTIESENNKYYSYAIKVNSSDNLISKLSIKGLRWANVCETRKQAEQFVNTWREQFQKNGTYFIEQLYY